MLKKSHLLRLSILGVVLVISVLTTGASFAAPQVAGVPASKLASASAGIIQAGRTVSADTARSKVTQVIPLACPSFPYTVPAGDVANLINAIDCANSSAANEVINLTNSTYILTVVNNTLDGDNGLPVIASTTTAGTLTINGNSATITRSSAGGTPNFRIFCTASGSNLTLNNVTLSNGLTSSNAEGGGAIRSFGALTVSGSTISNNTATAIDGPAAGVGGGIYHGDAGALTVSNTAFSGNWAELGGGIYNSFATVSVTGATFSSNIGQVNGGGIYISSGTATVSTSTFTSNSSDYNGGGILNGGTLTVSDSDFTGNSSSFAYGGGISNSGTLTVTNSDFSTNSAPSSGGGGVHTFGNATVSDSTFSENTAFLGGAVYSSNGGNLTVTTSALNTNTAIYGGGAYVSFAGSITVTASTLDSNTASYAGAIYASSNSTLTVNSSTVSGNEAYEYGGAFFTAGSVFGVNSSTVSGNVANFDGGGIYNSGSTINVNGSTFFDNVAGGYGGGMANSGGDVTFVNATLTNNSTPSGQGGGIANFNSGTLIVRNSTISGNSAGGYGGGVYGDGSPTMLYNTIVANSPSGGDCDGALATYTLIEDGTCGITNGNGGNRTGDPNLGALASNGGSTQTMALLAGSPAINAGNNAFALNADNSPLTTDQRGTGFPRILGILVDMGAYESTSTAQPTTCIYVGNGDVNQLITAINAANANADVTTICLANYGTYVLTATNNSTGGPNGLPVITSPIVIIGKDAEIRRSSTVAFRIFNVRSTGSLDVNRVRVSNGLSNGTNTGGGFYNAGSLTVSESCIVGNIASQGGGIFNAAGAAVNAVGNWWGDDSGPSGNAYGSGDAISANVNYLDFKSIAPLGCGQRTIPANDLLDTPTEISSLLYNTSQDVNGATVNSNEPFFSCAANRTNTVWFHYTPSINQTVTFSTAGSSYDTVLAVYTGAYVGSYAGFTEVGCNDNPVSGQQAVLELPLTAGTSYFIQIAKVGTIPLTTSAMLNLTVSVPVIDPIFSDGFESGNLSAWTANVNDGGDLSVTPAAALMGSSGMQALLDDITAIYMTDDTPNAEARYRARFLFDPNSVTMANNDNFSFFFGFQGASTSILQAQLRRSGSSYQVRVGALDDSGTWGYSPFVTVSDAPHLFEIDWLAATAAGANNGALNWWLDEAAQTGITALDTDTRRVDRVRLGGAGGIDAGTSGTVFFDAFISRRQTYIGRLIAAPTLVSPPDASFVTREVSPNLSWGSVAGATQYYAEFSNGTTVNLNSGWIGGTTWALGVQPQGPYTWRVKARSADGEESVWSAIRALTVRPGVPTNLQGSAATANRVNLTWTASIDAPAGITSYRIYRGGVQIGTSNSSTPSFTDNGAVACTANQYKVRSVNGTVTSLDSSIITVNTPCDPIFSDGFESVSLSAWSLAVTDGTNLASIPGAQLTGSARGLRALINDTNAIYVGDDTPVAEARYRARFYFDPNGVTMANNDNFSIFYGFQGTGTAMLQVQLRKSGTLYQLRTAAIDDAGTWLYSPYVTISNAPHIVELDWQAASAAGANNGALAWWLDETPQTSITALDSDTRRVDRVRLGTVAGIDAGTSGTVYFDAFRSGRVSYIGPEIGGLGGVIEPTVEPTEDVNPEITPEATVEPTAEVNPEATDEPTAEVTPEATASPTEMPTIEPTAVFTPEPTAVPTVEPTLLPFTLPVFQMMDDGAPLWSASSGWHLGAEVAYSGLGWQTTASGQVETLTLKVPVTLGAAAPTLSFQSKLVSGTLPEVRVSLDGVNWQTVAVITPSLNWALVTVDLSAYTGQTIRLQFVWVSPTGVGDTWEVDEVTIAEGAMVPPPAPTATETAVAPGSAPTAVPIPTVASREGGAPPEAPADLPPSG